MNAKPPIPARAARDVAEDGAKTLFKKAPPWAAGMVLIVATVFTGLWFLREPIISIAQNQSKIEQLEATVKQDAELRVMLEQRIAFLQSANEDLRARVAALENSQHTK